MPLQATGVLFQIVIDVVLFNVEFNTVQIVLIFSMVAVKAYELTFFYCVEIPRTEREALDKKKLE